MTEPKLGVVTPEGAVVEPGATAVEDAGGGGPATGRPRELVLLVHGMGMRERDRALGLLDEGLEHAALVRNLALEREGEGETGHRLYRRGDGGGPDLEVREVYWGDLQPSLSAEPVHLKLWRGLGLLAYWGASPRLLRTVARQPQLTLGALSFVALFVLWYLVTIVAVGTAQIDFGDFLPAVIAGPLNETIGIASGALTTWGLWAVVTFLVGVLPVTAVLDTSYASKAYLQNRDGTRDKVVRRLARELVEAHRRGDCGRITVLAHSFGTVPAVETLAEFRATLPVRLITLGGPLEVVAARCPGLAGRIEAALGQPGLEGWRDFWSGHDWMSTAAPVPAGTAKFAGTELVRDVSLLERATERTHLLYFGDLPVLAELLRLAPPRAAARMPARAAG